MKLRYKFVSAAIVLVLAAAWMLPRIVHVSANAPQQDCAILSRQLRQEVDRAFAHASLTAEEHTEIVVVRTRVRELAQLRRDGKLKDHTALKTELTRLRSFLDAAPAQYRRDVSATLAALKTCEAYQIERKKTELREALIEELGLPLGLLAYYAASSAEMSR